MAREFDIAGDTSLSFVSHGLQFGSLRAASALVTTGIPTPGQTWIMLAVTDGGITREDIVFALTKGYITRDDPVIWTGRVPLTGTNYLVAFGRSLVPVTVAIKSSVSVE